MLEYIQSDFRGGMNLFDEDYALAENEYGLAYNVRNRTTALSPIAAAVEDTGAPSGLKQGIFAFDNYLVLFNNGAAHYKNIVTDSAWTQIAGFAMDTTAPYIYTEPVPTSKFNNARKLQEATRIDGTSSETNVDVTPTRITELDAGLVCQDGLNQPFLILADGTARRTQRYDQWSVAGTREYVPVAKQMKYFGDILFAVAPDGKTLYRSVSGRPLDFVVNVDVNGNKGGDADTTSYAVGYNSITALAALNSGELLVGTTKTGHLVNLNFNRTIFAEPTFLKLKDLSVGFVNQHSFVDIQGDYVWIDIDGIRSFNAVANDQNEGRNSVFSTRISKAFAGIKQSATAAIVFDNYSLFAVTTIYGSLVAVYDNTRGTWVSFDNYGIGAIKQFAVANQSNNPTLYAITASKVYKLFSSPSELVAQVNLKALSTGRCSSTIKLNAGYATFDGGETEVTATLTEIVNNTTGASWTNTIGSEAGSVDSVKFDVAGQAKQGWKVRPKLTWQNEAKVAMVEFKAVEASSDVALKQKAQLFSAGQRIV